MNIFKSSIVKKPFRLSARKHYRIIIKRTSTDCLLCYRIPHIVLDDIKLAAIPETFINILYHINAFIDRDMVQHCYK